MRIDPSATTRVQTANEDRADAREKRVAFDDVMSQIALAEPSSAQQAQRVLDVGVSGTQGALEPEARERRELEADASPTGDAAGAASETDMTGVGAAEGSVNTAVDARKRDLTLAAKRGGKPLLAMDISASAQASAELAGQTTSRAVVGGEAPSEGARESNSGAANREVADGPGGSKSIGHAVDQTTAEPGASKGSTSSVANGISSAAITQRSVGTASAVTGAHHEAQQSSERTSALSGVAAAASKSAPSLQAMASGAATVAGMTPPGAGGQSNTGGEQPRQQTSTNANGIGPVGAAKGAFASTGKLEAGTLTGPTKPATLDRAVAAQAVRGLAAALRQGSGSVTMRLAPEALGDLKVEVRLNGQKVDAKFEASTAEAAKVLEAHRESLRGALQERGLTIENLTITVKGEAPVLERLVGGALLPQAAREGIDHATGPREPASEGKGSDANVNAEGRSVVAERPLEHATRPPDAHDRPWGDDSSRTFDANAQQQAYERSNSSRGENARSVGSTGLDDPAENALETLEIEVPLAMARKLWSERDGSGVRLRVDALA